MEQKSAKFRIILGVILVVVCVYLFSFGIIAYHYPTYEKFILKHLANGKKVCVVSPELHGRHFEDEWKDYKKIEQRIGAGKLMICTDYSEKARLFFNGKKK